MNVHRYLLFVLICGCLPDTILLAQLIPQTPPLKPLMLGQGTMVAEVSDTTAVVQTRLTSSDHLIERDVPGAVGTCLFELYEMDSSGEAKNVGSVKSLASEQYDFIARTRFKDLKPNTQYTCVVRINSQDAPPASVNTFKTLADPKTSMPAKFVIIACMNYAKFHGDSRIDRQEHLVENNTELAEPYDGPDKNLGYPALAVITQHRPDFLVGTGDNVYFDTPEDPRAKTIPEMRQKYHEQWVQPRFKDLFAVVPTYWEVDDHDYRVDDCDNTGNYLPSVADAQHVMKEQIPYGLQGEDVKTYRTVRVNHNLQLWLVEGRIYRSPNNMPDGPEKTIWGAEQKAWLKKTLLESDAKFKLLISPTPLVGPDDARKTDNHANIGGFQHERDEFFKFLIEHKLHEQGFAIICGDRHWQYHSRHPSGIEEFGCGSIVDENSRTAQPLGSKKSTDPDGLIERLYSQEKRSGGFLELQLTPPQNKLVRLTFTHYDDKGTVLYTTTKMTTSN